MTCTIPSLPEKPPLSPLGTLTVPGSAAPVPVSCQQVSTSVNKDIYCQQVTIFRSSNYQQRHLVSIAAVSVNNVFAPGGPVRVRFSCVRRPSPPGRGRGPLAGGPSNLALYPVAVPVHFQPSPGTSGRSAPSPCETSAPHIRDTAPRWGRVPADRPMPPQDLLEPWSWPDAGHLTNP